MSNPEKLFAKIALEQLFIETLETQNSDRLDFHDCGVAGIKKSLELAYAAGKASAGLPSADVVSELYPDLGPGDRMSLSREEMIALIEMSK